VNTGKLTNARAARQKKPVGTVLRERVTPAPASRPEPRERRTNPSSRVGRGSEYGLLGLGIGVAASGLTLWIFPDAQLLLLVLGGIVFIVGWFRPGRVSTVEHDLRSNIIGDVPSAAVAPRLDAFVRLAATVPKSGEAGARDASCAAESQRRFGELEFQVRGVERGVAAWIERVGVVLGELRRNRATPAVAARATRSSGGVDDVHVASLDRMIRRLEMVALNAAIEAARAKEYGRGFAIVANEVRGIGEKMKQELSSLTAPPEEMAATPAATLTARTEDSDPYVERLGAALVELGGMFEPLRAKAIREKPGKAKPSIRTFANASGSERAKAKVVRATPRIEPRRHASPPKSGTVKSVRPAPTTAGEPEIEEKDTLELAGGKDAEDKHFERY
jgi:hypothetical protein